jgi:hypothetical protein
MLFLSPRFGKKENRCGAAGQKSASEPSLPATNAKRLRKGAQATRFWIASLTRAMTRGRWLSTRT